MAGESEEQWMQEEGKGRHAERPREIPARGWRDVLLRTKDRVSSDHVMLVAAGVAFYSLFALFPMLAALVSVFGLVSDPAAIRSGLVALQGVVPEEGLALVERQLTAVVTQEGQQLGVMFVAGLAVSLWSANRGIKAMFEAMNIAYSEEEKRGFIKLNAITLAFTVLAMIGGVLSLFAVVAIPALIDLFEPPGVLAWGVALLRWPILLLAVLAGVALIYRYGPSRARARWSWVSWGGIAAAIVWLGASALFSWYATAFGNFNETYGALGAAIAFMFWIWLSALIVIMGAELNAELEHQTATDTTVGREMPLGRRGAVMADTLGAPR